MKKIENCETEDVAQKWVVKIFETLKWAQSWKRFGTTTLRNKIQQHWEKRVSGDYDSVAVHSYYSVNKTRIIHRGSPQCEFISIKKTLFVPGGQLDKELNKYEICK